MASDSAEGDLEREAGRLLDGYEGAVDRALPPHLRARAWARRRRATHVVWQAAVLVLGFGLVAAGIVMLVLPGPGWAAIILGLVVLASEYAWARRLLDPVRRGARRAADAALDPRVRRRNLAIAAAVAVVVAGASTWYLAIHGLTLEPMTALLPG